MTRFIVLSILIAGVMAAQNVAPDKTGSISGVVVNAATGKPVPDAAIRIRAQGVQPSASTDDQGRYTLKGVQPGRYSVSLETSPKHTFSGTRIVSVGAGQDVRSIDFRVFPDQSISGTVSDENGDPLPGVEVALLGREYVLGGLRYYRQALARTDDQGQYQIPNRVTAGTHWLVWARQPNRDMKTISDTPADPKLRRPATIPTYYPSVASPEQGIPLVLGPGEQREGVDIRMMRSPSYCLEAQLDIQGQPGELSFWIHEAQPSFGIGWTGGVAGLPSGGKANPDGKIRLCDLHRGEYRLTTLSGDLNAPDSLGTTLVSITDRDVTGVTVVPQPPVPLPGEIVWANEPPQEPVKSQASISLLPLHRSMGGMPSARSSIPGEFAVKGRRFQTGEEIDPPLDEYRLMIVGLRGSLYLKDVTYGGTSTLHKPLLLGSAMAGARLRVILGHDGGVLKVHVADGDGEPVAGANVFVFPKETTSPAALALTRITGQADQNGDYASPALAPGSYYALATEEDATDLSPETLSRLLNARPKAKEVEVKANATVELLLEPVKLDR